VNTWSVEGFLEEATQPAELGWGTHEKNWPADGGRHDFGPQQSIFLNRPGAATKVRTWTPSYGPTHGFLISHSETISISQYLTLKDDQTSTPGENSDKNGVIYRPTVHYSYCPCPDAILSIYELHGNNWKPQEKHRIMREEIVDGRDELGVLLMGNEKGAYWFGSQLSIQEARELCPYNTATSLQVAITAFAAVVWAMKNPEKGIVEPEDLDFKFILDIAKPYLGPVVGVYTDWTPIQDREESLFNEPIDISDPWQFTNTRVQT